MPEFDTVTLPAYWASALVNGDFSGLDPDETIRCQHAIERLTRAGLEVVSDAPGEGDPESSDYVPQEPRFTWSYGLYDPEADCSGGDVLDYVVLKRRA